MMALRVFSLFSSFIIYFLLCALRLYRVRLYRVRLCDGTKYVASLGIYAPSYFYVLMSVFIHVFMCFYQVYILFG